MKYIPPEPEPELVCADVAGCEFSQDCPFAVRQVRSTEETSEAVCPISDVPVTWVTA